jgi:hypothetical protein
MSELDDLDARQRRERRERMQAWSTTQNVEIARAKRVIEDPGATQEEKRQARILVGAYSVDPVLMAASGDNLSTTASFGHAR